MQKQTPHCDLSIVRELIRQGKVRATFVATRNAEKLGLDALGMVAIVLTLTPDDFYKSTTTYIDDEVWRDVYRPKTQVGDIYLKLTVVNDVLIVSSRSCDYEMSSMWRGAIDPRHAGCALHL